MVDKFIKQFTDKSIEELAYETYAIKVPKGVKLPSEYQHQVALVSRCRDENILIHAIENSLQFPITSWFKPAVKEEIKKTLHRLAQKRIKAGQLNGVPDLFVPLYRLYIEMKKPGGKATKDQLKIHEKLRECGYDVIIAYSAKEAWEYIQKKRSNKDR